MPNCRLFRHAGSARAKTRQRQRRTQRISATRFPGDIKQNNRIYFLYRVISFFLTLLVLGSILYSKLAVKFRDLAERVSSRRFVQSLIFTPLLVVTLSLLELPADAYIHRVSTQYGLSIQSWPAWFSDWSKQLLLTTIAATVFVWLLYAIIRKSPRRWWVYFWLASVPIVLFLAFIQPFVIDPLRQVQPLAADLSWRAALGGWRVACRRRHPVERMFWMAASEDDSAQCLCHRFRRVRESLSGHNDQAIAACRIICCRSRNGPLRLQHIAGVFCYQCWVRYFCFCRVVDHCRFLGASTMGVRGVDDYAALPALLLSVILVFICNLLSTQ
jgi:hypothetical protein